MPVAVVNVDVQGAFLDGGELGDEGRNKVIDPIVSLCEKEGIDHVYSSRDLHPPDHSSFKAQGGKWDPHAVEGTPSAEIDPRIMAVTDTVINKGMNPKVEEYSAAAASTGLAESLEDGGFDTVIVTGLCTDYCVRETALDLARLGHRVIVPLDCIQGVEVNPGDCERALADMRAAGCEVVPDHELALSAALSGPSHGL
jgi:nicotinamidase/pyrazinamidase